MPVKVAGTLRVPWIERAFPAGEVFLLGVFAWVFLRISLLTSPHPKVEYN